MNPSTLFTIFIANFVFHMIKLKIAHDKIKNNPHTRKLVALKTGAKVTQKIYLK